MHLHQEETGDSVAFVEPGKISASWSGKEVEKPSETQRKEHQSLAEQYNAYSGGLREDDLNRAFLVLAAENYVLQRLEEVKSRNKLNVTPQMLWNHVKSELDFAPDEWMEMLVPILVQDGWVLSIIQRQARLTSCLMGKAFIPTTRISVSSILCGDETTKFRGPLSD